MVSKRRSYTREFKIEAVLLVTDSDLTVKQVAKDLDIPSYSLYKWIDQYSDDPKEAFPGKGKQTSEAEEINALKREVNRLRMERDILKKAMAIFSNDPK